MPNAIKDYSRETQDAFMEGAQLALRVRGLKNEKEYRQAIIDLRKQDFELRQIQDEREKTAAELANDLMDAQIKREEARRAKLENDVVQTEIQAKAIQDHVRTVQFSEARFGSKAKEHEQYYDSLFPIDPKGAEMYLRQAHGLTKSTGNAKLQLKKSTRVDDKGNTWTQEWVFDPGTGTTSKKGNEYISKRPTPKKEITEAQLVTAEQNILEQPKNPAIKPFMDLFNKHSDKPYTYVYTKKGMLFKDNVATRKLKPGWETMIQFPVTIDNTLYTADDIKDTAKKNEQTILEVLENFGII